MFKLGVITDEISQDFEEACSLAEKHGLSGVEIRSVWEKGPHELEDEDIEKIKTVMNSHNLVCCGIAAPLFKCELYDEKEFEAHLGILNKCIHLAKELGTKQIRGFTFWKRKNLDDVLCDIVKKYHEITPVLEKEDIYVVIEFDPSVYATNAKQLRLVVDAINHDRVKALWDPGNDISDPDCEVPYPDGYSYIKDVFCHMHLKDAVKNPDGSVDGVPFGTGEVDFKGQFSALLADGYDGWLVMETHYRPKHEISKDLLELPKGSAFSMYGYEATDECLTNLKDILSSLDK
ncbi:MAG: TIM barrel protein [Oscillospiraceae bacterium]|nr:TIM barrel protein [Oscillospiraceae bacterium]